MRSAVCIVVVLALLSLSWNVEGFLDVRACSTTSTDPTAWCAMRFRRTNGTYLELSTYHTPDQDFTIDTKLKVVSPAAVSGYTYPMQTLIQMGNGRDVGGGITVFDGGVLKILVQGNTNNINVPQLHTYYGGNVVYSGATPTYPTGVMGAYTVGWTANTPDISTMWSSYNRAAPTTGTHSGYNRNRETSPINYRRMGYPESGSGASQFLDAEIAEVRFWNGKRIPTSDWNVFYNPAANPNANLRVLFQADKTCDNLLLDVTGNMRHATMVNFQESDRYPSCYGRGKCVNQGCVCDSPSYSGIACHIISPCTPGSCPTGFDCAPNAYWGANVCKPLPPQARNVRVTENKIMYFSVAWDAPTASDFPITHLALTCTAPFPYPNVTSSLPSTYNSGRCNGVEPGVEYTISVTYITSANTTTTSITAVSKERLNVGESCYHDVLCKSNNCFDNVCCSSRCTQNCARCNLKGQVGNCTFSPEPRSPCPQASRADCGSVCVEGSLDCVWPTFQCSSLFCSENKGTSYEAAYCNEGDCREPPPVACNNYICDGSTGECPTNCTSDAACIPGYACSEAHNVCKSAAGEICSVHGQCASGYCTDGICYASSCDGPI